MGDSSQMTWTSLGVFEANSGVKYIKRSCLRAACYFQAFMFGWMKGTGNNLNGWDGRDSN